MNTNFNENEICTSEYDSTNVVLDLNYFVQEIEKIYESLRISQSLEIETLKQIQRYENQIKAYEHFIEKLHIKVTIDNYNQALKTYNNKQILLKQKAYSPTPTTSSSQKKRDKQVKHRNSKLSQKVLSFFFKL